MTSNTGFWDAEGTATNYGTYVDGVWDVDEASDVGVEDGDIIENNSVIVTDKTYRVSYEVKNYEAALENYEKSYFYNEKIQSDYINKVRQVTNSIIDQANDATNRGDILFALSSLNQLITLRPELEKDLNFGLEALKVKLEDLSDSKTQAHIQNYIESEKNRAKRRVFNQIEIGMSKDDVFDLMGPPAFIENKYTNDKVVELWFYFDEVEEKYVNFYFENSLIIRVD